MGLLDLILRECMNWLHDAHRVVWTVLMLLSGLAFGRLHSHPVAGPHWGAACSWASSP